MNQIKRYFDCQVPVKLCNFECDYCTIWQWRKIEGPSSVNYILFPYSIEHMVKALTPQRLGGICAFSMCGDGETLLHPQIIDFSEKLLEQGHYIAFVTNGTITPAIERICSFEKEMRSRVFVKFSFHYVELLNKNMVERFFDNVNKIHQSGVSFTIELVASDSNVEFIDEIKKVCIKKTGALCHLTVPRANTTDDIDILTQLSTEEHIKTWSSFDSEQFEYKHSTWGKNRRENFCYGGVWSFNLILADGRLKQCYRNADTIQYIFDDIDEPIHYLPRGHFCTAPHCYNSHVFDCFAGVCPEIKSPTYDVLRNRKALDNSEWLKEPYKEIYSVRICDNNKEYTNSQKIFADGIMRLAHDCKPTLEFSEQIRKDISRFDKRAVVYGENRIAEWLVSEMGLERFDGNADDAIIIVTDYSNYVHIKQDIKDKTTGEIISVVDIQNRVS